MKRCAINERIGWMTQVDPDTGLSYVVHASSGEVHENRIKRPQSFASEEAAQEVADELNFVDFMKNDIGELKQWLK